VKHPEAFFGGFALDCRHCFFERLARFDGIVHAPHLAPPIQQTVLGTTSLITCWPGDCTLFGKPAGPSVGRQEWIRPATELGFTRTKRELGEHPTALETYNMGVATPD
jgi:hypothetical protein